MEFKILSIVVENELVQEEGDFVGYITLENVQTGEIQENVIWYSEDDEHYFCYPTDELNDDDEPILEDELIRYVKVGDIIG